MNIDHALQQSLIRPQDLSEHVRILASNEFEGRSPGSEGERKTVDYLSHQFARLNLEPAGEDGTWFQSVPLRKFEQNATSNFVFNTGKRNMEFRNGVDAAFRCYSTKGDLSVLDVPVVFVGYGISAPELGWDDYKGIDLSGKIALYLINDPDFESVKPCRFGGHGMTFYGRWVYKFAEAARRGAVGALIVHEDAAASYDWTTVKNSFGTAPFDLGTPGAPLSSAPVQGWLSREAAISLFSSAGLDFSALKKSAMDESFAPVPLAGVSASVRARVSLAHVPSRNVIARIPGRLHPDQSVFLSAHWDHLGVGPINADQDNIYHGAIDNATALAGLFEMARLFMSSPRPSRSVYFMAFTAEEKGLLGSEHYVQNPTTELAKVAAVLNMEVLGYCGPTRDITIWGPPLSNLNETLASIAAISERSVTLDPHLEAGYFYRSDHFSFAKMGVPSITLSPGYDMYVGGKIAGQKAYNEYFSKKYHRPADCWSHDMELRGVALDLDLIYRTAVHLANDRKWPRWEGSNAFRHVRDLSTDRRS